MTTYKAEFGKNDVSRSIERQEEEKRREEKTKPSCCCYCCCSTMPDS